MWKCLVATLPRYLTAIYNGCLKEGVFPKRWKEAKIIPIVKPGKEGSEELNKFRPISLLASGGKVLEMLLINRINHHVFSRGYMNDNQFGFRPQKSTVDAAMAIKAFVQESLVAGESVCMYVYKCVCMCVFMYVCMYVCMYYVRTYVRVYECIYVYVCVYEGMYVYMYL